MPMLICTAAWSLAVMRRLVHELHRNQLTSHTQQTMVSPDAGRDESATRIHCTAATATGGTNNNAYKWLPAKA